MIIKKLAVPFINDKLLQQVEHCYIATAAITGPGFDFIRARIPTKTKMEIITGLELPSSPEVLRRIWRNYQGRITLNIYTRNVFHANLYIFDLPYRKSVAFVGSGQFTLEGIKDSEELFYKISDAKEIENLKSWFIGYYEFAQPLTDAIIDEYEWRYPTMRQRDYTSRLERKQFLALTTGGFSWEHIKLKHQYFKKEDYLALGSSNDYVVTPELQAERVNVQTKLLALHTQIKDHLKKLKLHEPVDAGAIVSSIDPALHAGRLQSISLIYGRNSADLKKFDTTMSPAEVMHLKIILGQRDVSICLVAGAPGSARVDREYFQSKMLDAEYRTRFFSLINGLGPGYWIDVACDRRNVDSFATEEALWEFTKGDLWRYYDFSIGKNYSPEAIEISSDNIAPTIMRELDKLSLVFQQMKTAFA